MLSTGYGVRAQFLGHDLHGLRMGPDGKLYFSIGDRGLDVMTKEGKRLSVPDCGCVLRCDPDGARLEVVHTGLRNPQELAFDDAGNLFTWDNNSDSGDRARWVHVVEGGDSGWRCGYQYGSLMHHAGVPQGNRGPWNAEGIWHVPSAESAPPAYVVPPLKHFGNGPSGITAYPGVGLSDKFRDHFFACDFTASASNSLVWSLAVTPKGASFEVTDLQPFAQQCVPTDCEFGPDGAFYVLDWVGGWTPPQKGRIFRVADPEAMKNPAVAEAKKLLAEGFEKRPAAELARLLAHPHRQVRYEAQYELAGRKDAALFVKVLAESKAKPARVHAAWGLVQLEAVSDLASFAGDLDTDIRVIVARGMKPADVTKTIGIGARLSEPFAEAVTRTPHFATILKLIVDPEPRVRAAAAAVYGTLLRTKFQVLAINPTEPTHRLAPLFDLLAANNDQDVYLRQAAVEGLVRGVETPNELVNAWKLGGAKYDVPAVRMGVVLALRKLKCNRLGEFLADADPRIVAEAARAIYDQDLTQPMPALAKLADTPNLPDPVAYRAVAANYKLGTPDAATRVAEVAGRYGESPRIRELALKLLAGWDTPARLDPITGLAQSIPPRPAGTARAAVTPRLKDLFAGPDAVRREAAATTAKLGIAEVGPFMKALALDAKQPVSTRVEAGVRALGREGRRTRRGDHGRARRPRPPPPRRRPGGQRQGGPEGGAHHPAGPARRRHGERRREASRFDRDGDSARVGRGRRRPSPPCSTRRPPARSPRRSSWKRWRRPRPA